LLSQLTGGIKGKRCSQFSVSKGITKELIMPRLHYAGQRFELSESSQEENIVNRIDRALTAGRNLVGNTPVPTKMAEGASWRDVHRVAGS
jgi:hypothetical protein